MRTATADGFCKVRQGSEVGQPGSLSFKHAAGEATGLQSESVDLVSCSLLMHELPQHASKAIMREARRVLRPGGIFSIMACPLCKCFLSCIWTLCMPQAGS